MATDNLPPLMSARYRRALGWSALYFVLVAATFTFPQLPGSGLDPSWRMALGYMFENGMQFGKDVIFTYGPLGFIMSKTFSGLQFWSLIVGQLVLALISATVIVFQGRRLIGSARLLFFGCILLFAVTYEDALHMVLIAILGFELLRIGGERWLFRTILIAAVLAVYSQIKFTDFMLASFVVLVACGYRAWQGRWRQVGVLALGYVAGFLAIWLLCGQQLGNLPLFFQGSWAISQGYQWAMAFPSPYPPLWKGLVVLGVIVAYAFAHLKLNPDKPRAVANVLVLAAFTYLNWKHGFVRSDGHMIGFFFCAMLPLAAYPALLDDPARFRLQHRWVFLVAIVLSIWGIENALWGVSRNALGMMQGRVWNTIQSTIYWKDTRQKYRDVLSVERTAAELYQTREQVGKATIDVVGFEQNVAIMNRFNYRPRPIIQSYSTFMPLLARLNYDFYASANAPDFLLVKIQTIDGRLPTMDDSMVLRLLPYRYEFVRTEKAFQFWKKVPGPFDASKYEPKVIHTETVAVDHPLQLEKMTGKPLWLKVDLRTSFLGAIRSFLYKPPQVMLKVKDVTGNTRSFLMPLPMGRTGFIVSPVIDDGVSYMEYTASRSKRLVTSVTVEIAPQHRKYFADTVDFEVSEMVPPKSGQKYFTNAYERMFHMFKSYPVAYDALNPFSETVVEGRDLAVMHAPSEMTFDVPPGATSVRGRYGFVPGAYSNGGRTNGAEFLVYWSNGTDRIDLFQKLCDPLGYVGDRGLQYFEADLKGITGGRIYLQIKPGPYNDYSWDWTGWTDIEIK